MEQEQDQNRAVRDAISITNILNKHLLDECSHCTELLRQVEFHEDDN